MSLFDAIVHIKAANLTRSDPHSPNYGNHHTAEQVADLFAPPNDVIQSVAQWLYEEKIKNITLSGNKQWLLFDSKLLRLEQLLDTIYYEYEHPKTGRLTIGCNQYV